MSKLAEFKALEAQLAVQLKQLDLLRNNGGLKREIEFEEKLRKLLAEYGFSLRNVVDLLDPQAHATLVTHTRGQRRTRVLKVYKNPETGEVVETKGGNHKVLKSWKEKYGAANVEGWLQ